MIRIVSFIKPETKSNLFLAFRNDFNMRIAMQYVIFYEKSFNIAVLTQDSFL